MFNKTQLMIFGLLFVLGCAHRVLRKDVSPDEAARDDAQCRSQSMQVQEADYAYRGTFMEGANIKSKQNDAYTLCLVGKGYK